MRISDMITRARVSICEGWYVKGDELSENRKNLVYSSISVNVLNNLVGGSFWTGLLLLLNADDSFVGLMTIFATGANMLQMFAPLLLERFKTRKTILRWMRMSIFILNVAFLGFIPFFPIASQAKLTLVGITVFLVNVINAATGPGLTVWHVQSMPDQVRPSFFAFNSIINGVIVAVVNLLGSQVVDLFKAGGNELLGLTLLRVVAMGLAFADFFFLSRIKEYPYECAEKRTSLTGLLIKPFKNVKYLKTVAIACLWSFTANLCGPYFTVYLLNDVKVSYSLIMWVSMLNVPALIFLTPVWTRIIRRTSWLKALYISIGLYSLHYILLSFTTAGSIWVYPVVTLWAFIVSPGINLAFSNVPYINIPAENQTESIGFYSTMANLAALLGVTLGRQIIAGTEDIQINLLGVLMKNKQYLLVFTGVMMALGAVAIYFLQREGKKGVKH